jgi:AcrR family transcriptional regulator
VELFAAQGYDGTTVDQVIKRAGVTKGGLYHHFVSKQELLYEVYGDLITIQLKDCEEIIRRGDRPGVTLRALIVDLVETTTLHAPQALVFFRELSKLADDQESELRRARRHYHETVVALIRDAQSSGEFASIASAEISTFIIFGVLNELPLWYRADGPKRPIDIATELADFVLAALEPTARPNSGK